MTSSISTMTWLWSILVFSNFFLSSSSSAVRQTRVPIDNKGTFFYGDQIVPGEATGYGKIFDQIGNLVFEGDVVKGKAQGLGTIFLPNGQTIKGSFEDSLPVKGEIRNANGMLEFEGPFKNGAPDIDDEEEP